MTQRYCPGCDMVLASGVQKCRFCDHVIPADFWSEEEEPEPGPARGLDPDFESAQGTSRDSPIPRPMFPHDGPDVSSNPGTPLPGGPIRSRSDSRSTPLPKGADSSLTPLPENLAPPIGLDQGSSPTPVPDMFPTEPAAPVAPGATGVSAALEAELSRVIRGESDSSAVIRAAVEQDVASIAPNIEAFTTRRLLLVLGLLITIAITAVFFALGSGQAPTNPARMCAEECQLGYESGVARGEDLDHMNFMSACVAQCLRPPVVGPREAQ